MTASEYKYTKTNGQNVVFAEVIKPACWNGNRHNEICHALPVGAITWFSKNQICEDENGVPFLEEGVSVHPEDNRHHVNFNPSCFQLLLTSNQKLK